MTSKATKRLQKQYCALAADEKQTKVRRLHAELFPEEYDHMMDSYADAQERNQGRNPMSAKYTMEVNARRAELGFKPLGQNGMPEDSETRNAVADYVKTGGSDAAGFIAWRKAES